MKAAIGSFRRAFSRKHSRRIFTKPAIGVDTARVWITAWQVFLHQEVQQFPPVAEFRRRDLGYFLMTEALLVIGAGHLLAAYLVAKAFGPDAFPACRPLPQQVQGLGADFPDGFLVALAQYQD